MILIRIDLCTNADYETCRSIDVISSDIKTD